MKLKFISLQSPSPPLFLMILILILIHVPRYWCAEDDEQYVSCGDELIQCGEFFNIGYPFWGVNRPQYCGHPKFQLDCQNSDALSSVLLQLKIDSVTYRVIGIEYSSRTLTVAREWINNCPTYLHNQALDSTLFIYTSSTEILKLYYGCPSISGQKRLANEFDCPEKRDPTTSFSNRTYYYVSSESSQSSSSNYEFERCSGSLDVPVFRSEVEYFESNSTSFKDALDHGFGLQWTVSDTNCTQCVESGGRCGFDSNSTVFTCFCADHPYPLLCNNIKGSNITASTTLRLNHGLKIAAGISTSMAGLILLISISMIYYIRRKYFRRKKTMKDQNEEAFFRNYGSYVPKRYKYSDIKRMTTSFKNKLGQGGYGVVYKGKLVDGQLVAVKVLSKNKGSREDFINEVATISRTSHVNVVTFLGFCYERKIRALVYEFMSNGSLDKFIYSDGHPNSNCHLDCKILYQIAIGVARGLEYLHRGCSTRIVHFDIKPHNILLDEDFCPKIADFGLAKLGQRKTSIMSMEGARGTAGYIAPEVLSRNFGGVSHKSDVYSYGMMILEIIGGRNDIEARTIHSSEKYFPDYIYEKLEHGEDLRPYGVTTEEEKDTVKKMTIVSLWCIQTNPTNRPSMNSVVEMLEGSLQSLQIPPKPILSSPPRLEQDSSIFFLGKLPQLSCTN